MSGNRKVEVFSAGCPACQDTIDLVNKLSCSSCDVIVQNMNDEDVSKRAKLPGIHRVPAVVVDGKLADCCSVSAQANRVCGTRVLVRPSDRLCN